MLKYILVLSCIAVLVAAVDDDAHAHVEKEYKKDDGHGHFSYGFDATNGIGATETGDEKDVQGEYHYVSKEGVPIKVSYTADANGYHPQGDILPVAPPVPAAILKGLEYIKAHPHQEEHAKKGGHGNHGGHGGHGNHGGHGGHGSHGGHGGHGNHGGHGGHGNHGGHGGHGNKGGH